MAYTYADKREYWGKKEQNAERAKKHTKEMESRYGDEIKSIATTIYSSDAEKHDANAVEGGTPQENISVCPLDSVSAIFQENGKGTVAVLNFASYKNPGGRFLDGSMAQEEALCHTSYLYNVLRQFQNTYYAANNYDKNRALYRDRALYSRKIRFFKGDQSVQCDVITCACPNKTAAQKYQHVSNEKNLRALQNRCDFVLSIAAENSVDTLILGAYGCGVFGQDPEEVAECFANGLKRFRFNKVVFAIPNTGAGARNYAPFAKRFC